VKLKRKINLEKDQKTTKRMMIKINIQNKNNFFLLKGEIEKKINFNKRKKIKRMRIKLVKTIHHKFELNDEIESK
jgi:hypothetical protein